MDAVSKELYETLSLAARYFFALLGVLIVLRAFYWLFADHSERRRSRRRLPNAEMIGEMVVLSGGADLREGDSVSVPWEGILGSVRSCDVCIPGEDVRRKHLFFRFEPGQGLLIQPFRGCETLVDGQPVPAGAGGEGCPMRHGSLLQAGQILLRLRVFAGLDPNAGFPENAVQQGWLMPSGPVPGASFPEAAVQQGWAMPSGAGYPENAPQQGWAMPSGPVPGAGYPENAARPGWPMPSDSVPGAGFPETAPQQGWPQASGANSGAGFPENAAQPSLRSMSGPGSPDAPVSGLQPGRRIPSGSASETVPSPEADAACSADPLNPESPAARPGSVPPGLNSDPAHPARRRRRSDRWEVDWSE